MLPTLKSYLKSRLPAFINRRQSRETQLDDELRFWDKWLRQKGLEWPDDFRDRLNPETPLAQDHRELIDHLPQDEIRILDVGAGPLTVIGKRHPSKRLAITAVDVLAEKYAALLARQHIQPVIRTSFAEAESLTNWFAEDSFDLVNARNCLDHSVDPFKAIGQILLVTRPGCFACLDHVENEGEKQRYRGLHQWNFTVIEDEFVIRGHNLEFNVSRQLADRGEFQCSVRDGWLRVRIRKK